MSDVLTQATQKVHEYINSKDWKYSMDDDVFRIGFNISNEQLMNALDQLTPIQRRRVVARFFDEKSSRVIATEEGVNYSKVDNSIKGALKKLQKILA